MHLDRPHPRSVLAALLVAAVMLPVGLFLAAIGVWVLDQSGGAARDTSLVVVVAGYLVTDFWGGGIVAALTRARARQVALLWVIGRAVVLALVALLVTRMAPLLPVQLLLAVPAAYAGARVGRKQAAMRREIEQEQGRPEPPAARAEVRTAAAGARRSAPRARALRSPR